MFDRLLRRSLLAKQGEAGRSLCLAPRHYRKALSARPECPLAVAPACRAYRGGSR